jgi:hypothetical protein
MIKQLAILVGFAILVAIPHFFIFQYLNWDFKVSIYFLYAFMIVLTFLFDRLLVTETSPNRFINYYMGFSGGKLILSLFILLLYGILDKAYLRPFAASFLVIYFSFTSLEIVRLVRHLKN